MAAEEHLQIIRQGVDARNEWRKKNPNPELKPEPQRGRPPQAVLILAFPRIENPFSMSSGMSFEIMITFRPCSILTL